MRFSKTHIEVSGRAVVHSISVFATAVCLLALLASVVLGSTKLSIFFAGYLIAYAAISSLSAFQRHTTAALSLYIAILSGITILSALFGPSLSFDPMFLLLAAFPVFIFPQHKALLATTALLPFPALWWLHNWGYAVIEPEANLVHTGQWLYWALVSTAFIALWIIMWSFRRNREEKETISRLLHHQESLNHQLESALQARSRFLSTISHELRTPLNGILGATTILKQIQPLQPDHREFIEVIETSGQSLHRIVDNILELTTIHSKRDLLLQPVSLCELLNTRVQAFRPSALAAHITLETSLPHRDAYIHTDPHRLSLCIDALVDNAIKFSPSGSTVSLRIAPPMSSETTLRIIVRDYGVGFDVQRLHEYLQPFRQHDEGLQRRYGGLGLGLALCSQVMDALGGYLDAQSQQGLGSTMSLCFDTAKQDLQYTSPALTSKPNPSDNGLPQKTFLIVEDNPVNQKVLAKLLERHGALSDIASNGQVGLELFQRRGYDAVLMDLQMPVMDGFECIHQIRLWETAQSLCRTPILVVSANSGPEERRRAKELGAEVFLSKPLSWNEIHNALHEQLDAGLHHKGAAGASAQS